jgi:hypothetical protein
MIGWSSLFDVTQSTHQAARRMPWTRQWTHPSYAQSIDITRPGQLRLPKPGDSTVERVLLPARLQWISSPARQCQRRGRRRSLQHNDHVPDTRQRTRLVLRRIRIVIITEQVYSSNHVYRRGIGAGDCGIGGSLGCGHAPVARMCSPIRCRVRMGNPRGRVVRALVVYCCVGELGSTRPPRARRCAWRVPSVTCPPSMPP